MPNQQIRAHQLLLLEMLHQIDDICSRHDIKYMLYAGSALGAVRHHGFIPWDDDLDIIMKRSEYEKFLQFAEKELDKKKYFLQKEYSEHWPVFFSKLRKNNTACIERFVPKDPEMHQGIYIDIFPWDNLSDKKLVRGLQFLASKVVIAKSHNRRGYLTDSLVKKAFIQVCKILPEQSNIELVKLANKNSTQFVHGFFAAGSKYKKSIFPRQWMEETIQVQFEDGKFPISANYDELLTTLYGDYMKPTPPEERGCKVHGVIVDLENSYENYIEEQKKMKVTEYERSIR